MALTIKRPGRDMRLQMSDRLPAHQAIKPRSHRTLVEIEAEMDEVIETSHRRRLEHATGGRLTFQDGKVVNACRGLTSQS